MSALPFSPLTLNELNERYRETMHGLAHSVAACFRVGSTPDDHDIATWRTRSADADALHEAAMVRVRPYIEGMRAGAAR